MGGNSKRSGGSRAIPILRLQKYICVQSTVGAKLPLAHKQLLYEVPSLRVTSVFLGGEMRQHRRFCDFGVHWGQERQLFSKISAFLLILEQLFGSPGGNRVDGLPRAASLFSTSFGEVKVVMVQVENLKIMKFC